ncbi:SubName: Full=Uncharacterized protein {ECO:0000313/EMBL:CCA77494.1} [Serendipita indica DSM 11827]|nr:SubName: Full=Uncharacterized protein {ECO:0000313/EMBL:CCA77494.1} [Serendipita indica DSM 11827]
MASGPQKLEVPGLYTVVRFVVLTEFARPAVYASFEEHFQDFTALESLEIQSKAPMSTELYKKIRDHLSLRHLVIHLDGDALLYRKPFQPRDLALPKCRLCSLKAPSRILFDLLQPGSATRRSLTKLELYSIRQIGIMHQILSAESGLDALEELRLDLGSWSPSGKSVLDILLRVPSLKILEFMPNIHPYFTGLPPSQEITILPNLRLLTGPTNAVSFLLPYLRDNCMRICINDSDFADWIENSLYMAPLFSSTVGCKHLQELYIYTAEVYHSTLLSALSALPSDGLPSLQKLVIERDIPLRRQDGGFKYQLDSLLNASYRGACTHPDSLETLRKSVQKRRAIFTPFIVAWAKRSSELRLQSILVGDWDVTWFSFECIEIGSTWRVLLSPNNDLCFKRFLETYPEEEITQLDLQTAIYQVMGEASDDEELPNEDEEMDEDE